MVPVSPIVPKADNRNNRCQDEAQGDEKHIDVSLIPTRRHRERDEDEEGENRPRYWRHSVLSRQAELHYFGSIKVFSRISRRQFGHFAALPKRNPSRSDLSRSRLGPPVRHGLRSARQRSAAARLLLSPLMRRQQLLFFALLSSLPGQTQEIFFVFADPIE
jgi:hypothetical protein